jgi:hypothetical protein
MPGGGKDDVDPVEAVDLDSLNGKTYGVRECLPWTHFRGRQGAAASRRTFP